MPYESPPAAVIDNFFDEEQRQQLQDAITHSGEDAWRSAYFLYETLDCYVADVHELMRACCRA